MNATANLAIVTGHPGRVAALIVISVGLFASAAAAQTAKEVKGATPLVAVSNEPSARLGRACSPSCAHRRTRDRGSTACGDCRDSCLDPSTDAMIDDLYQGIAVPNDAVIQEGSR
jgi:hypothetical protein